MLGEGSLYSLTHGRACLLCQRVQLPPEADTQVQTNTKHALNFALFSVWTVISLMNYHFLIRQPF